MLWQPREVMMAVAMLMVGNAGGGCKQELLVLPEVTGGWANQDWLTDEPISISLTQLEEISSHSQPVHLQFRQLKQHYCLTATSQPHSQHISITTCVM
ncbi:hypothetical protein E2C01_069140 [Portunus trituberculatus]|uniref:Uncharacterized protein n=1 Tax=Portunus trituberculatus TaxID=210409 RepID=A0A5B7HY33_PORTR|nr:hypothetical protein [Portunus trituberculatus]